jgi:hypothetical protein
MYRYLFFLSLFLLLLLKANAGEQPDQDQPRPAFGIRFTGFIKSDYWYDSRQVVSSRENLFMLMPANRLPDLAGNDINAHGSFNFTAIASRLTGVISGPDAFGAKTSGLLEADFSGVSNADINGFRLRHAFGRLRWENSELLLGQFWHPMFVTEVFPEVVSLNTGAPFQPFIRNPQLSFTQYLNDISLQLTLLSQRDNSSDGPLGIRPDYIMNSLMPNVHLQLLHKTEGVVYGLGVDYKVLRPRLVTDNFFITDETIDSWAFMAFGKFSRPGLAFRTKAIYGQNLSEHLLLGGYAVRDRIFITARETYTPTNHLFLWGNLTYGTNIQAGLFAGYAKNFGTTHENIGIYYGRGSNIDYMYRFSPSVSFLSGKAMISTELEYTVAAYGRPDNMGKVQDSVEIGNLRGLVTLLYFF